MRRIALVVGLLALGCGSAEGDAAPKRGGQGEACSPTHTCDDSLVCMYNACGSSAAATSSGICSATPADTDTGCYPKKLDYTGLWSESPDGIVTGEFRGSDSGSHLGTLVESSSGQFSFTMDVGHTATCVMIKASPMLCIN